MKVRKTLLLASWLVFFAMAPQSNAGEAAMKRDSLLSVARASMQAIRYCALTTIDSLGRPHVRMMDPFPPDEKMNVWLGTNRRSRKVREIRRNPHVALYYSDNSGNGYVVIVGDARIIDDAKEKTARWKQEWSRFYDERRENYLLIKVVPERLEIVNYEHGLVGDSQAWGAPFVDFKISMPGK